MRSLLSRNICNGPSLKVKQQASDIKRQAFEIKPSSHQGFVDEDEHYKQPRRCMSFKIEVHQNKWFKKEKKCF